MSLINKFSVQYNLEQANKKRKTRSPTRQDFKFPYRSDILSNNVASSLIELGYKLETLLLLLKVEQFSSVEEVLELLEKDSSTGKYNHKFYNISNNSKDKICEICKGDINQHNEIFINNPQSLKKQRIKSFSKNINNPSLNNNTSKLISSFNNDITQSPFINENHQSLISNEKELQIEKINSIKNHEGQNNKINQRKLNLYKIDISKETLDSFDSPNICHICFSRDINKNNIAQTSCGHFFCDECIKTYITSSIVNGKVMGIKCLMGGCPKKYTDDEIKLNVNEELFKKYKKFKNQQIKLASLDKNYVNCPFPNCDELVQCENFEGQFIECNNHHLFCIKCRQLGVHKKGKCKNMDSILLQEIQKGNKKNGTNYKQCPKCKVIIEKNEGCNQMHCINCGLNFCWLCLRKYTDGHYALYNIRGCPGMRFETDSGSRWTKVLCLKVIWYCFSCILGFFALLLVLLFYLMFGCSYELVNCYTKEKVDDEEEEEEEKSMEFNIDNCQENSEQSKEETRSEELKKKSSLIICILAFLGVLCQPFYLMFYMLYGLIECYRRFNCWLYNMDY